MKAELLAPCGNFDCVLAALNAGADAVYLGGQLFNARAYASNFDNETLEKVCDLCHSFGVKVYVTVNTLYKDQEFADLFTFVDALYAMGVDGLIMQDLGAIRLVRENWPDLNIHASTQLTVNCIEDVRELEALGIKTVVLSRELNLDEIRNIAENTNVRVETFIHGALCVSYSGQCLMSSVLGNRSGNRGKCAQNCRLNYELLKNDKVAEAGHLLSTKDICTLELLPELLEAGAVSLKIEGRMKSPEYVAGVTGIYRKYLDKYYAHEPYIIDPEDIRILRQLFNRGSFSTGYLKTHSGLEMMCPAHPRAWGVRIGKVLSYDAKKHLAVIRSDRELIPGDGIEIRVDQEEGTGCYVEHASAAGKNLTVKIEGGIRKDQEVWQTYDKLLMDSLKTKYDSVHRKVPIDASVVLRSGLPSALTLAWNGNRVRVEGEVPAEAKNQPLTKETVISQISKLGNSIYTAGHVEVDLEDGLFLNKSALNALKNEACEALRSHVTASYKREPKRIAEPELSRRAPDAGKKLAVKVRTPEQFRAAVSGKSVSVIYLEMNAELMDGLDEKIGTAHNQHKKIAVQLPRIWRTYIQKNMRPWLEACKASSIDGWLISNLGHYHDIKDTGKEITLNFTGNVLNSYSAAFWNGLGVRMIGVSPEMSRDEINALSDRSGIELLAYGHLPLMVTHQCPIGNFAGRKKDRIHCACYKHSDGFILRSGKDRFIPDTDCLNCVCTIIQEEPLDIRENLLLFGVPRIRLDFTGEDAETATRLIRDYEKILASGKPGTSAEPNIYDKSVL